MFNKHKYLIVLQIKRESKYTTNSRREEKRQLNETDIYLYVLVDFDGGGGGGWSRDF